MDFLKLRGKLSEHVETIKQRAEEIAPHLESMKQQAEGKVEQLTPHIETAKQQAEQLYDYSKRSIQEAIPQTPETIYGETALACEEISDSVQRIPNGTTSKVTKLAAGKLGMLGTSSSIFGIAASVGTASTGTAIGSLSGAAATSATAAWLGGSVAMGSAIIGVASIAGGIGFAAGAIWLLKHKWQGEKRLRDDLTDREKRIVDVATQLSSACRALESKGIETAPTAAKTLYEETLQPLADELEKEAVNYTSWPIGADRRVRNSLLKLRDLISKLTNIASKAPTATYSALGVAIASILHGDLSDLSPEGHLVLDALRRSSNALSDASDEELGSYISSLSDAQLDGVLNNVKGIYHEILFVTHENSDGDEFSAAMFEETNYPGADVIVLNNLTGETEGIQLKATQYRSYVEEHQSRYEDIEVYATSEVADPEHDITSSGFSNEDLTKQTKDTFNLLDSAEDAPVDDAMVISALISLTMQCGRVLKEKDFSKEAVEQGIKDTAKASFLAGLASWMLA